MKTGMLGGYSHLRLTMLKDFGRMIVCAVAAQIHPLIMVTIVTRMPIFVFGIAIGCFLHVAVVFVEVIYRLTLLPPTSFGI